MRRKNLPQIYKCELYKKTGLKRIEAPGGHNVVYLCGPIAPSYMSPNEGIGWGLWGLSAYE